MNMAEFLVTGSIWAVLTSILLLVASWCISDYERVVFGAKVSFLKSSFATGAVVFVGYTIYYFCK